MIHLKDFYTGNITSLTVQNCKDVRVVLDCPALQRPSLLQRFHIKDCDRLEFVTLSSNSIVQTPPEVVISNIKEIVSLPRKIFKSPSSMNELKCSGTSTLKKIKIVNSKINSINTRAIFNVSGIKSVEFDNVTIMDVQNQAIEAIMGNDNTIFSILNSRIENLKYKGITVQSTTVIVTKNIFDNIITNTINITADNVHITRNKFKQVNGLVLKFVTADISRNNITVLKGNALTSVKCIRKKTNKMQLIFSKNNIENLEPYSLIFDFNSCKPGSVAFTNNKINCKCRDIAFINSETTNAGLRGLILDVTYNNTCLSAPCILPVDVLKLLLESDMCQVNLDTEIMCLLYNDKHAPANEVTTDEQVTEPEPTFYLIKQANPPNGDVSAAMTAINKDDLLRDSNLNMTNRTAIKIVFDSSRDFVETLRSISTSQTRQTEKPNTASKEEYVNQCVGAQCRNNVAYDRQKALEFYKYVYAQLRSPIKPIER